MASSREPEPEGVADRLISALVDEGRFVDDGNFSLDPSKALEKLRGFQLAEPHAYVLLLVEAAVIAGASSVELSCGPTTIAEYVGTPLTRTELENVFNAVFVATDALAGEALAVARIQQLFGVAANAALSLGPRRIEIESCDRDGRVHRVTIANGAGIACERVEDRPSIVGRTRFCVVDDRDSDRDDREVALIRERCHFSNFTINLYGRPMNAGHRRALVGLRTERVRLTDGTSIGLAGLRPEREPAKLLLLTRGVLAETLTLERARPGFLAVVEVDLRKDLSQRGVLRGPEFDEVLAAVLRAHARV